MTDFLEQKEYQGGIIVEQYKCLNDLYIITRVEGKYKLFLDKKKIGESKDVNVLHERIPDYR